MFQELAFVLSSKFLIKASIASLLLLAAVLLPIRWHRFLKKREYRGWLLQITSFLKGFLPLTVFGYCFLLFVESFVENLKLGELTYVYFTEKIFLLISLVWFLMHGKKVFFQSLLEGLPNRKKEIPFLRRDVLPGLEQLTSVIILLLAGFSLLDILGVPVSTLLAFGGIGGLAVSWASKDVIANFFGGLMIFITRPFTVGDWIRSPNKSFEGVVETIGWYRTKIRSFERRPMYLPNAMITDAIVENPGRMYNRRIKADIGLRYQDIQKVDSVVIEIKKMLKEHPEIDQNQICMVHFMGYLDSSLQINIYTFTKTTNWEKYREVQQEVLLKVGEIVLQQGADFAFPTRSLFIEHSGPLPTT